MKYANKLSGKVMSVVAIALMGLLWIGATGIDMIEMAASEERPLAIVRRFKPQVIVKHSNAERWKEAKMGEQLFNSDTLRTQENGYAAVQFMDNSLAKIKPNSLLVLNGEVNDKNSTSTRLAMEVGEIFLNVTKRRSEFEVSSDASVASVKGTSFGTNVEQGGATKVWVVTGSVALTALKSGQNVNLEKGMYAQVDAEGSSLTSGYLSKEELDNLTKEYEQFDSQTESKTLKLKFRNNSGQEREIDVQYFNNN